MKYQKWKIKTEHHVLKEFKAFLEKLETIEDIKRIIPWRISRQQKWTWKMFVSFSYYTKSWLKYKIKKWATAQELFIVCENNKKKIVKDKIESIKNNI